MAAPRKKKDVRKAPKPDGQLRQSQLVTTFGPGAMVDLGTMGGPFFSSGLPLSETVGRSGAAAGAGSATLASVWPNDSEYHSRIATIELSDAITSSFPTFTEVSLSLVA